LRTGTILPFAGAKVRFESTASTACKFAPVDMDFDARFLLHKFGEQSPNRPLVILKSEGNPLWRCGWPFGASWPPS